MIEEITYSTVEISVVLQGGSRPDSGWAVPVAVKFFAPGADVLAGTPIYLFDLATAKSGTIATCQCDGVTPGTYDIAVACEHTLVNVKRNVVIPAPATSVSMRTLLEGNANNDGIVNIADFGILSLSYGKSGGQPGFDARVDFDRNGRINISDFGLLAINYARSSPVVVP